MVEALTNRGATSELAAILARRRSRIKEYSRSKEAQKKEGDVSLPLPPLSSEKPNDAADDVDCVRPPLSSCDDDKENSTFVKRHDEFQTQSQEPECEKTKAIPAHTEPPTNSIRSCPTLTGTEDAGVGAVGILSPSSKAPSSNAALDNAVFSPTGGGESFPHQCGMPSGAVSMVKKWGHATRLERRQQFPPRRLQQQRGGSSGLEDNENKNEPRSNSENRRVSDGKDDGVAKESSGPSSTVIVDAGSGGVQPRSSSFQVQSSPHSIKKELHLGSQNYRRADPLRVYPAISLLDSARTKLRPSLEGVNISKPASAVFSLVNGGSKGHSSLDRESSACIEGEDEAKGDQKEGLNILDKSDNVAKTSEDTSLVRGMETSPSPRQQGLKNWTPRTSSQNQRDFGKGVLQDNNINSPLSSKHCKRTPRSQMPDNGWITKMSSSETSQLERSVSATSVLKPERISCQTKTAENREHRSGTSLSIRAHNSKRREVNGSTDFSDDSTWIMSGKSTTEAELTSSVDTAAASTPDDAVLSLQSIAILSNVQRQKETTKRVGGRKSWIRKETAPDHRENFQSEQSDISNEPSWNTKTAKATASSENRSTTNLTPTTTSSTALMTTMEGGGTAITTEIYGATEGKQQEQHRLPHLQGTEGHHQPSFSSSHKSQDEQINKVLALAKLSLRPTGSRSVASDQSPDTHLPIKEVEGIDDMEKNGNGNNDDDLSELSDPSRVSSNHQGTSGENFSRRNRITKVPNFIHPVLREKDEGGEKKGDASAPQEKVVPLQSITMGDTASCSKSVSNKRGFLDADFVLGAKARQENKLTVDGNVVMPVLSTPKKEANKKGPNKSFIPVVAKQPPRISASRSPMNNFQWFSSSTKFSEPTIFVSSDSSVESIMCEIRLKNPLSKMEVSEKSHPKTIDNADIGRRKQRPFSSNSLKVLTPESWCSSCRANPITWCELRFCQDDTRRDDGAALRNGEAAKRPIPIIKIGFN